MSKMTKQDRALARLMDATATLDGLESDLNDPLDAEERADAIRTIGKAIADLTEAALALTASAQWDSAEVYGYRTIRAAIPVGDYLGGPMVTMNDTASALAVDE